MTTAVDARGRTWARMWGDESIRRAVAAVPVAVVVFYASVLFTIGPATRAMGSQVDHVAVWDSTAVVMVALALGLAAAVAISVTWGRRLDLYSRRLSEVGAVALFVLLGAVAGLVLTVGAAVALAGAGAGDNARPWVAAALLVWLPVTVAIGATRAVVAAAAESWADFVIAVAGAVVAVSVVWWVAADYA